MKKNTVRVQSFSPSIKDRQKKTTSLLDFAKAILFFTLFNATPVFAQFQLNGNTQDLGGGCYRLTDTFNWQLSSMFSTDQIDLNQSFDIQTEMLFGVKDGADGMTFVLQSSVDGNTAIGSGGGGIGFEGITPSVIVEFDTYQNNTPSEGLNNDPPQDHIAVLTNGSPAHVGTDYNATVGNLEDLLDHDVRITWNATTNNLIVYLDCVEVINYTNDIVTNIFGGDGNVYWGFTASTGGQNNRHDVCILYTNFFDELEDQEICEGEGVSIGLDDVPAFSYNWSPTTDLDNASVSNPTASPSVSTTYNVTITNGCGATITDDVLVTVNPDPNIPLASTALLCQTETSITLDAGIAGSSYAWSTSETTSSINVSSSGNYTVTLTDSNGCSNTQAVSVAAPVIDIELGLNQTLCDGEELTLDATPTGGGVAPTYEWQDGSTDATFSVTAAGTFMVTVSDEGCDAIDGVTIQYTPLPNFNLGADQTPCEGETFTLDATPLGGVAPTYLWQDGSTEETFSVNASGTYTVTVTDQNCSTTDEVTFNYNPLPDIDLGGNQTFCDGDVEILSALPSNATAPTYEWQDGSTEETFSVSAAGNYAVTVTDQGCVSTDQVTINYNANPSLDFGPDITACGIVVVTLTPTTAGTYEWQDGSTNPSFNVQFPGGTYTVTVTANGCSASDEINVDYAPIPTIDLGDDVTICEGESYLITGPFADEYEWQDGTTNQTFNATQEGLYTLEITTNGCSSTDNIFVNVTPLPVVDLGGDVTLCDGETLTLTAPFGATYEWQDGSTSDNFTVTEAGVYAVTATANNCSNSDEITVTYASSLNLDLGGDLALCEGETTILDATTPNASYQWSNNLTTSTIEVSAAGNFAVTVTSGNCSDSDAVEVSYNALPTIDLGEDITLCEGETTTLSAPLADTYEWSNGSTNQTIEVSTASTHSVTITTDNCSSSDEIEVFYNDLPVISLGEDLVLCEGETTTLDATPSNAVDLGTVTYEWQDGSTDPTFPVSVGGIFAVTVTADDCRSTDEVEISFDNLPSINLGEDQTLCEGEILELDATLEGATYEWQDGSTDPTFPVSVAGTYAVTVTLNTCVLEGSINIDYQALPVFDLGENQTLCEGETAILDATTANATYEWQNGSTDATFSANSTGDYSVSVTANGCTATDMVSIDVTELPMVDLGADPTLCEGEIRTLEAMPSNSASFSTITYEWQDGSTDSTFDASIAGTYAVTVTADNCSSTDEVEVTVDEAGTIDLGENLALCEGETAILDATTAGATYEWQDGSTDATFSVAAAGTYAVTVSTGSCFLLGSVDATYSPQPAIDLGATRTICEGETVTLNATTANATYEWQNGSTDPTFEASTSGTYAVTVSVNNCSVSDEVEVIVNPLPALELGAAVSICEGETTTLSAPLADTYLWSDNSSGQDLQVSQSGTYTVTITSNNCSNSDEVEVNVNPTPSVDLGGDVTLCQGETTTLDATFAGATYEWQDGSTNPTFDVDVAGIYAVTVSVGDCSSSDEINIDFDNAGTIDLGEDATLCEGETTTLDATTADATYEWQDGSTNPTFEVSASGTYAVTVTIAGGCLLLGDIDVDFAPQPNIDLGADLNFCEGESELLDASLAGATYEWQDGSTNPTFNVTASGLYAVTVSVGNCSTSDAVNATVGSAPVVDLGTDISLCEGETATLSAPLADTYLWSDNSSEQELEVSQSGTYTVTVTTNNCSNTDEIEVLFNPSPTVNLGADVSICSGETVTLDATFAGATYEWQDGSTDPTFDVDVAGTYAVTVSVGNCSSSDEINIDFDDAGTVDLGADAMLCDGENLVLDATTPNATYEWQDGSTNETFNVTTSGIYAVTVSVGNCDLEGSIEVNYNPQPVVELGGDLDLCEGENATLDANFPGATYEWQDGSTNETFNVTASGLYAVTVTLGNCSVTDELTANVTAIPAVDLGEDISICGESVALTAPLADTYVWSTGDTDSEITATESGTYTVTITNGNCSNSDEINVDLGTPPSIDLGGTILLCGGLGVTLDVTQADATATYEWQDGSTDSTYDLTTSGTYGVTVTVGDCVVSDEVEVTLQEDSTIDLGATDTVLCAGQSLLLSPSVGDAYLWQDGSTESTFEVSGAGVYAVTVTLDECVLEGSINVTEAVAPTIDLGADITICEGESVVLEGVSTDAFSFLWLENGATTETLEVTESGVYTLQVFAENATCAMASDDVQVTVEVCEDNRFQMVVPTAFSPNGDGVNDELRIEANRNFLSVDAKIFNRWGVMVHSSTDTNLTWDGMIDGEPQPIGVYVYYVLVEYEEDGVLKQELKKGNVSLVR